MRNSWDLCRLRSLFIQIDAFYEQIEQKPFGISSSLLYLFSISHQANVFLSFVIWHETFGMAKKTSLSHKQNYNICIGIVSIIFFRGFSKSQLLQAFEKSQIQRFQHLKYSKYEFIAVKFNEIHLF